MQIENLGKSWYYNVLLDETKVFDIKISKTCVLLTKMEFLRKHFYENEYFSFDLEYE